MNKNILKIFNIKKIIVIFFILLLINKVFADSKNYNNDYYTLLSLTGYKTKPKDLQELVEITQKNWLRVGERNDIQNHEYQLIDNDLKLLFTKLGYKNSIYCKGYFDVVIVLGCKFELLQDRIIFLKELIQNTKVIINENTKLFLLGSDRKLDEQEKVENRLLITETNIFEYLVKKHILTDIFNTIIYVDPHCNLTGKRCNTDDTLIELFNKNITEIKQAKSILVISSQPYIQYQDKVVKYFFKKNELNSNICTAGHQAYDNTKNSIFLDSIARDIYMVKKLD